MQTTAPKFTPVKLIMLFFIITTIINPIYGLVPRKLDDTTPDSGVKCGSCPCNNPCPQSPPPPSPPPPSLPPPPPSPPPPSPPPPKKPPTPSGPYCPPPPPPSGFIYITGPPGNLYPVDPYFSAAGRNFAAGLWVLIGCGVVGLLAFW